MQGQKTRKGLQSMFRTLEEHAERFHGKRPGLIARMFRFKMLVFGSVLAIGTLLTIVMGLD
jgi:hypothetical protein